MKTPYYDTADFRLILATSRIYYDKNKETINREKHGYSLESAVYFLSNTLVPGAKKPLITREIFENGEIRNEHITFDDHKNVVFFVTTMREPETIRVISLRRAHEKEVDSFRKCLTKIIKGYS